MPRPRSELKDPLSFDGLTARFRRCQDGRQKARGQALWRLADPPRSADQAAGLVGRTADGLRELVRRDNAGGPPAVERNAGSPGRAPRLPAAPQEQLEGAVLGPAPDGGLWTGPKLARRAAALTGQAMHPATGWAWLRELGLPPQRPGPRSTRAASREGQAARERKAGRPGRGPAGRGPGPAGRTRGGRRVPARAGADRAAGLGAAGAAADGPAPAPAGMAVRVRGRPAGAGRHVLAVAAGSHHGGRSRGLAEGARWADPDGRKRLVLVVDRAGGHTSGRLVVPGSVEMPPDTPELQPAEAAWPLAREEVANHASDGLEARTAKVVARCRWFMEHPEAIRAVVGYDGAAALNQ